MSQFIYLKDLFVNGSFGSVVLGINSEQVRAAIGVATSEFDDPPYHQYYPSRRIWLYGNITFSFDNHVLDRIYWEYGICSFEPCLPDAGVISLDPWIVWNGLTLLEAEGELRRSSIEFRRVTVSGGLTEEGDDVVELITGCHTRLIFRGYLNWHLERFELSTRFQIDTPDQKFYEYYMY